MSPRYRSIPTSLLLVVFVAGCSNGMGIEEARQATIVDVGGTTLDGATLEELMLDAPAQARPSAQAANLFISAFVDGAVLRRALIEDTRLDDSTLVREVIEPDAILGLLREGMAERALRMPEVTDAQADSLGRLGAVRVFQQIFFQVADYSDSLEGERVRARLRAALQELTDGTDFGALAMRLSDDSVSRGGGGILPALTRGDLPEGPLANAAWGLSAGEYSSPALSPAGVHLLRRLPLADARPGLKTWLVPRLARQADSLWIDSVRAAAGVQLAADAIERTRALTREPFTEGGEADLVTWEGGGLSPDRVRMWFSVMPAPERAGLPVASDSAISTFLRTLADRELRYQAGGFDDPVPARAWDALAPQLTTAITQLVDGARQALTVGEASGAVRSYLTDAASGLTAYRPLPGALGMRLRRGVEVSINADALEAIIASASNQYALRQERDSLAAVAESTAAGPAPGGP